MPRFKLLVLAGAAAAAAAGAFLKRDKVMAAVPFGRSGALEPPPPHEHDQPRPQPSNYDTPGPPANSATPIAAPDPVERPAIDEAAEEAAAAADAAAIGGQVSSYAGHDDPQLRAGEADRPLMEAGEGFAEGEESAEDELRDAAEPFDTQSPYERQIDEAIERQDDPLAGERGEEQAAGRAAYSEPDDYQSQGEREEPSAPAHEDSQRRDDDYRTWSGQAAQP
jgi:hypothetical protein